MTGNLFKLSNKTILIIITICWGLTSVLYQAHTKAERRSHDFAGHLYYSSTIANEGRLPKHFESYETYHPPLYYFLCSLVAKDSFLGNIGTHVHYVRCLSALFGLVTLLLIFHLTGLVTNNGLCRLIILLFTMTTPKFVFMFSTYNNDSLSTLLCVALLVVSYKLYLRWSRILALVFLLVCTAGFYTKYTFIWCAFVIFIFCIGGIISDKKSARNLINLILLFAISFSMFVPWIYYSYKSTGKLFPMTMGKNIYKNPNINDVKNTLSTVLKFPIKKDFFKEWRYPWVYSDSDKPYGKAYDYFAVVFATSIIGEYTFTKPHESYVWIILLIHFLIYLFAIKNSLNTRLTAISLLIIISIHLLHIYLIGLIRVPVWLACMDFRFIAWSWACWSVLYASICSKESKPLRLFSNFIMLIATVIQTYILITLEGEYWS